MEPITLHQQDNKTYVTMLWPKQTMIAHDLLDSNGLIQRVGNHVIINTANGVALYKSIGDEDGYGKYELVESTYEQMTYTS